MNSRLPRTLLLILLLAVQARVVCGQTGSGTIRGVVVDTRDGAALGKVAVRLQSTGQTVITDEAGRFAFTGVAAGQQELYVSAVDFILVKRTVTVPADAAIDVTIALSEGTGTYTETVTVHGTAFERQAPEVASEQTLTSKDLQQLRGLFTNDPLRAIQMLPGVAAGDDLRSEFTVRGSGVDHMNFTFEGVSTPLLVHTVQRVFDTGSLAMVNGDVLESATLSNGAYPQRFGNRIGAELDFEMRQGARDAVHTRLSVSGTDAAAVMEGPLGRSNAGSWLVSVRKSYLDLVIARLSPDSGVGFGFTDVQTKLVYDVSPVHQVQLALTAGRSRLDQQPDDLDMDDVQDGRNAAAVAVASWRYLPSARFSLTQRVAVSANEYRNLNVDGFELAQGSARDLLYRSDWAYAPSAHVTVEGGGEVRTASGSRRQQGLMFFAPQFETRERFEASTLALSAYGQVRFTTVSRATLVPGVRVDRSTLTGHTSASPWLSGSWPLTSTLTLRGGAGVYRQEPTFDQIVGLRGTRDLAAERSYHTDIGIEGQLTATTRWQATVYNREERDIIRLPGAEIRVVGSSVVLPSLTSRYTNALSGHARGVEFLLQRRSANGLSGWASYSLGRSQYHDVTTGEVFWGNFDQRHTVNLYGLYRFNDKFSGSVRFRSGSNMPTIGYWESRDGKEFVSDRRNELRVPLYSRLDVRANRTFTRRRTRLTLFVEALNILGRNNVRMAGPGVDLRTHQAFGLYDPLFPFVPSAGLLLEF